MNEIENLVKSTVTARDNLILVNHAHYSEPAASGEGEDHIIEIQLGVDYTNAYNLVVVFTLSHIGDGYYDSAIRAHNNDWASLRTIAQYIPQALKFYEDLYGNKFPLVDN